MFPKNTVPTAAMPPEKPPVPVKEGVVLCMVEDKDIQVDIDQNKGTIRQTTICACAVVLTTLILVAGTLGAITIVLTHSSRFASDAEPHHTPQLDGNSPTELPEAPPRVKIDDGGLWPPQTTTSDLVVVEGAPDNDIKFGDGGGPGNVDNEVEIINDGVTPPKSEPTPNYEHSIIFSSSSSQLGDPPSSDYEWGRNYLSSSFPYDGYYMRGGVGIPPWEEESQDSQVTGSGDSSGDSQVVGGVDVDQEADESGSGELSPQYIDTASSISVQSSSYDDDNTLSDMYYDSYR